MSVRPRPSVRLLVALGVIGPLLIVAATLSALAWAGSHRIAERLGEAIVRDAVRTVGQELDGFLLEAELVSELYHRRLVRGVLSIRDMSAWEPFMLDDLATRARVASICIGTVNGDSTWLLRHAGHLEVGLGRGDANCEAVEYVIGLDGVRAETPIRVYTYDPRQRPWYAAGLEAEGGRWTPVYFWFGEKGEAGTIGTGFTRAVRDRQGALQGVLVIDVTLGGMSAFLKQVSAPITGYVFVVDGEGMVIAASDGPVSSAEGQRLALRESTSAAAPAAAQILAEQAAAGVEINAMSRTFINGEPARARATRLTNHAGLDWSIVTVLPESAFLGEARALQRRIVAIAMAALVICGLVGWWLARRIVHPVLALTEHVRRVGGGDFDARIELNAARELQELSRELNRMTADLRHRMELQQAMDLAVEVQRALLPEADPAKTALDLSGRSRYCDAVGGDYYDFIDVSSLDERATLIAVGDVMGHGVAAALLMASARAALRAHRDRGHDVAALLTRVNAVLADDARHQRFMTMALLVIDPTARSVRWASAGHDPALVYLPGEDRFDDLEGGDIPLGIMEGVQYAQYERSGLLSGTVIVVGTDGIWEQTNDAGEQYGKDRLREVIRSHHAEPAAAIAHRIEAHLTEFRGKREVSDDVTFVVAKLM